MGCRFEGCRFSTFEPELRRAGLQVCITAYDNGAQLDEVPGLMIAIVVLAVVKLAL